MNPGEIVVIRLKGGLAVARSLGVSDGRIKAAVGRNREARVPVDRVALATGMTVEAHDDLAQFRSRCEASASEIDLSEVWEVVRDESGKVSLDELADLYWGGGHELADRVALLLHLDRGTDYFTADDDSYVPSTLEAVTEIQIRRQREAAQTQDIESLAEHLSKSLLPPEMTPYQQSLMEHVQGFATYGDDYTRSAPARKVLEKVTSGTREVQRLAFDLLVRSGVFTEDEPLEIVRAGVPVEFPSEVLQDAAEFDIETLMNDPRRVDLTSLPTFTVDDATTRDRDDAVSIEMDESGKAHRIGIHIADAGALVAHTGAVDGEAARRMATLYLPEGKVPMVPPELSEEKGSLLPGNAKPVLSVLVRFDDLGEPIESEIVRGTVQVDTGLSYHDADEAMADPEHAWHVRLESVRCVTDGLRKQRDSRGAVTLDRPEMLIDAQEADAVEVRVVQRSTPSRDMVSELMILCNSLLADYCRSHDIPATYRGQQTPDLSDVVEETPEGPLRWYRMMRRLAPADLGPNPAEHGGLGVPAYIQATSPLRRYPDLVMQRQISHFILTGRPLYTSEEVASVGQRAEVQLRELAHLEEDRKRYWFLKYLRQTYLKDDGEDDGPSDAVFEAVVLENQPRRKALAELVKYSSRVRVELPPDHAPGDVVQLRLHSVDLWRREAQFVHQQAD
jgi:exoribonuclease-2